MPLLNHVEGGDQIYWLGNMLDFFLEILSAHDAKQSQATALEALKPSQMNRLQRSICRDRIPSVTKDSTVGVAMFLGDTLDVLQLYLRDTLSESGDFIVRHGSRLSNRDLLKFYRAKRRQLVASCNCGGKHTNWLLATALKMPFSKLISPLAEIFLQENQNKLRKEITAVQNLKNLGSSRCNRSTS
jgi:hypothetical protein